MHRYRVSPGRLIAQAGRLTAQPGRLTAHVSKREIAPDKTIDVWGYNGSAPGPTLQVTQGDRVRVILKNKLPEATSMHWHGFEDQIGYDGMPGISQEPVRPGESFTYNFTIKQEGTYFYHSHTFGNAKS